GAEGALGVGPALLGPFGGGGALAAAVGGRGGGRGAQPVAAGGRGVVGCGEEGGQAGLEGARLSGQRRLVVAEGVPEEGEPVGDGGVRQPAADEGDHGERVEHDGVALTGGRGGLGAGGVAFGA